MQQLQHQWYREGKYTRALMIAALGVFVLAMVSIFAQDIEAQEEGATSSKRADIEERREDARELREETKAMRLERFKLRGTNVLDRVVIRTNRLREIGTAIEDAANKAKEKGADTTAVMALIEEARASFSGAETLTAEARALVAQINEESDIPAMVSEFKTEVASIYKELANGRQKLIDAIQTLKTLVKESTSEQAR